MFRVAIVDHSLCCCEYVSREYTLVISRVCVVIDVSRVFRVAILDHSLCMKVPSLYDDIGCLLINHCLHVYHLLYDDMGCLFITHCVHVVVSTNKTRHLPFVSHTYSLHVCSLVPLSSCCVFVAGWC